MYVYCANCHKMIQRSAPRTVINGQWWCDACTYEHDRAEPVISTKTIPAFPKGLELGG